MSEILGTHFQIKPHREDWWAGADRVQFMNDCFDLCDIIKITAVYHVAPQLYRFDVLLNTGHSIHTIVYDFTQKSAALKAQRELARAYTKTGEFEYVEPIKDTGRGSELEP